MTNKAKSRFSKYAPFYDLLYEDKDYGAEAYFISDLIKDFKNDKKLTLLDAGCGTGIHAIELSKLGYILEGSDISREMIEIAREKVKKTKFSVRFHNESFQSLNKIHGSFDVILCMFSSINYLTRLEDVDIFFRNVFSLLKKDGIFIFDFWNGEAVEKGFSKVRTKSAENNSMKIDRKSETFIDTKTQEVFLKFYFDLYENNSLIDSFVENHHLRYFFIQEMKKILSKNNLNFLFSCPFMEKESKIYSDTWNISFVVKK
jgi:2-polyprenyl-3-methyl-5-hydroxy-6-metoxy-1,4-benzoquinol methylase